MTDEMMALRSMLEKGTDTDVLRDMIGFAAEHGKRGQSPFVEAG